MEYHCILDVFQGTFGIWKNMGMNLNHILLRAKEKSTKIIKLNILSENKWFHLIHCPKTHQKWSKVCQLSTVSRNFLIFCRYLKIVNLCAEKSRHVEEKPISDSDSETKQKNDIENDHTHQLCISKSFFCISVLCMPQTS